MSAKARFTTETRQLPESLVASAREAMAAEDSADRMKHGSRQWQLAMEYAGELWDKVGKELNDFVNGFGQQPPKIPDLEIDW